MKQVISYIKEYFYATRKSLLITVSLFTGLLIFCNYYFDIDKSISLNPYFLNAFAQKYLVFLIAFAVPYLLYVFFEKRNYFFQWQFLILLFLAPAIFALKTILNIAINFSDNPLENSYWNHVVYWPLLLILLVLILIVCWRIFDKDQPFYGIKTKGINWKPYWLMLLIMFPLIGIAATQPDFLAMYPKLKIITADENNSWLSWWHKLLYELSYGTDFIGIELFFRGFLIIAFIKWAGKDAILPMAVFYCSIHFGKPLGECISSYFGGIILGIVVYNTRSILGGLMVHLGIAWLMELAGYLGNSWFM